MTTISVTFFLLQALSYAFKVSAKDFDPPYGDNTALNQQPAPPWVDEPRKRGTLNILSGCIFTLSLCVYKAIHLNIPEPLESQWTFYRRKTKWVIIAILAPELVVYCAFDQFAQARRLVKKSMDKRPLSMLQAFYVAMGGMVIEIRNSIYARKDETLRVTIQAYHWLDFPDQMLEKIPTDNRIRDKSKADILSKLLICFQVVWMTVGVISRKILHHPLTVLEVHTLVHVICALLMYILWFRKPTDIYHSTVVVAGDGTREIDTYFKKAAFKRWGERMQNFDTIVDRDRDMNWLLWPGLGALCGAYGIFHLWAWSFEFPTDIEQLIWRACCISTISGAVLNINSIWLYNDFVLLGLALDMDAESDDRVTKPSHGTVFRRMFGDSHFFKKIRIIFAIIFTALFLLARLFIVVESFISIRKVPAGVYATVRWVDIIPHV